MNTRQLKRRIYRASIVVNASSGIIALATGGIFTPVTGVVYSRDLLKTFFGKEGMESDTAHFDEDSRKAIKRATAEILGKQPA